MGQWSLKKKLASKLNVLEREMLKLGSTRKVSLSPDHKTTNFGIKVTRVFVVV